MAYKLGIDLIEKERFAALVDRPGTFRRFATEELAYAETTGRKAEALAAAFAAKEAFYKAASGVLDNVDGIFWQALLLHDTNGRPYIKPTGELAARLTQADVEHIEVSITHNRTTVMAAVLLSSKGEKGGENGGDKVADILKEVVPQGFVPHAQGAVRPIDGVVAARWLSKRKRQAHKGDFGHTLIIGGSHTYPGAPQMAALAALSAGSGLVTMSAPLGVATPTPEVISHPIAAPGGILAENAAEELLLAAENKVMVVGMGLGREKSTVALCKKLFAAERPKVIDADGLYALSHLDSKPNSAILTPHEGELARLMGISADEIRADRLVWARRAAEKYAAALVLKGADTLVVLPDGSAFANTTGNPGMATGGSGDVLSGIIGAWLAQGLDMAAAACLGVYLHGLAGDLAAADKTEWAMTALDIVRYLPLAYRQLLGIKMGASDL